MSTCALPVARRCARSSGRRCSVCGPKTRSTKGARRTIAAPSWLATHPPTPIMRPGLSRVSSRTRPRSAKTYSCAFSRTEHVLNRMRSASAASAVCSKPSAAASTSAIFSESYSFIWHPKVRMKTFFVGVMQVLGAEVSPGRANLEAQILPRIASRFGEALLHIGVLQDSQRIAMSCRESYLRLGRGPGHARFRARKKTGREARLFFPRIPAAQSDPRRLPCVPTHCGEARDSQERGQHDHRPLGEGGDAADAAQPACGAARE